jgi:predicted RNase H-like HicB family nuclease
MDRSYKKGASMAYRVSIVIEKDQHGYYAFSPEIEGCQTQGASLQEVLEQARKTIEQYLEPCLQDKLIWLSAQPA